MLTRKYRSTTERKTDDAGAVMRRYGWICGAFAIIILLIVIEMKIISNASGYETREKVVVAARNIGMDAVITGDMLEIREISSGAVHRDAVRNIDEAVGMRAAADIYDGEVLLRGRLTEKESDAVEALNKSNRLFSLKPEWDQVNAWQLEKDQYVDVVFVPNHLNQDGVCPEAPGVLSVPPAQTGIRMMKNIRIAGFVDEDGEPVKDGGTGKVPRYILLEVTQEQAVFLAYAKSNGRVELSAIPDRDK
jgi:Flp pilus assembly protein CpaB